MSTDFLRELSLFRRLEDAELVEVLHLCVTRKYSKDSKIFAEGDPANKLYMIREGEVRISKILPGGSEEAFAILKKGDFFGEMSLIDESVRSAHATANTECSLMEISIKDLQALLSKSPEIAVKFLWEFNRVLAARLRATNDKLYGFVVMTGLFK